MWKKKFLCYKKYKFKKTLDFHNLKKGIEKYLKYKINVNW